MNIEQVEKTFFNTFGKKFSRKTLQKSVATALKEKEETFYKDLVSHLSEAQLRELGGRLSGKEK